MGDELTTDLPLPHYSSTKPLSYSGVLFVEGSQSISFNWLCSPSGNPFRLTNKGMHTANFPLSQPRVCCWTWWLAISGKQIWTNEVQTIKPSEVNISWILKGGYKGQPYIHNERICFSFFPDVWSLCHWLLTVSPSPSRGGQEGKSLQQLPTRYTSAWWR